MVLSHFNKTGHEGILWRSVDVNAAFDNGCHLIQQALIQALVPFDQYECQLSSRWDEPVKLTVLTEFQGGRQGSNICKNNKGSV